MDAWPAISLAQVDRSNHLLQAYLDVTPTVRALFAQQPENLTQIANAAHTGADRAMLVAELLDYQTLLGSATAAATNIRLLADPTTPVITAGQQPGLLTGALYTPYKALTAINVAQRLSTELGRPVVPLFWLGADDDDRAEVDHCGWRDYAGEIGTIQYPTEGSLPGIPVGDLPLGEAGAAVLAQLQPLLAGQPYAEHVEKLLTETLAASADFGEWCARLLAQLFSSMGLVICDPRRPAMRRLAREVMLREIAKPLATTHALATRVEEIHALGYHPALTKPLDVCNFFLLEGGRQRVTFTEGQFHCAGISYTATAMSRLATESPEILIPNAVLRPLVQEHIFGSSAFIAGPNELCYWAELAPVFATLDIPMPAVIPRAGATLIRSHAARALRHWGAEPVDLLHKYEELRATQLRAAAPPESALAFSHARLLVDELGATLEHAAGAVDVTLAQSAQGMRQRLLNEVEKLEHKTLKAVDRRTGEITAKLQQTRSALFPHNGLQERTLNIFSVMAQVGPDFPALLQRELMGHEGEHLFLEVE